MAIRMQQGRKRPFFVFWTNPFTKKKESKSCETKEEAEKLDAYIKYQLKYERDNFRRTELSTVTTVVQTVESILYMYLKERNLALANLDRVLSATKDILAQIGGTPIKELSEKDLADIKNILLAKGNKASTVRRKLGIIKATLHWAQRSGYIDAIPVFPQLPAIKFVRYVPPSPEELFAIFQVAPRHLQRVLILGYYLGMRVGTSELLRLKWTDIDLSAGVVRVPNAAKGNKEPWREVPILDNLLPLFLEWQKQDIGIEYVVTYKGQPVKSIRTAWRHALRNAGISRHLRPYDLRHGFATQIIAGGADIGTVAVLMGHSSPLMVLKHYQHVLNQQKQTAINSLPSFPDGVQNKVCK